MADPARALAEPVEPPRTCAGLAHWRGRASSRRSRRALDSARPAAHGDNA
jgi:hypothetical protein